MSVFNKAKYLSLLVLLGAWGCTSNQYASRSGDGYDDLYGGSSGGGLVLTDRGADQEVSRQDNPDYAYTGNNSENGTSDYYDENYLSSRGVKRQVSSDVGYNAGFVDGYNAGSFNTPYYGGLGSYWPGSYAGLSLNFGYGGFRMRPSFGFGYGSMFGYSPWGYGSMLGYGGMMGYGYDPFGYSPWGYNSMYGWGGGYYDSFYGGYGYSPWAYSRPVIVINNPERGISRTYGPRVVDASRGRNSERYNSNFVNSSRSRSETSTRGSRDGGRVISGDTYSSPRSTRSSGRGNAVANGGRTSGESYGSRSVVDGGNVYYSRPRSASSSNYSSEGGNTGGASYSSPRSSRSSSYSAPSYNNSVPSRSQSDYSAPSRSYSTPRSESYSAPTRTYSQPSYSAPSRSYSAPSSSGGGGGGSSSRSSRGPR